MEHENSLKTAGNTHGKLYTVLFILLCAFITGFMWRVRGDHGWGGFAGMTAVASGLLLAVITYFPYKRRVTPEILLIAVFFTAITNSGWGTLNSQVTGILSSGTELPGVSVSPLSGIAIMLLLGFGWAPFLALFLGFYMSDKEKPFYHYIIIIALFYAVQYAAKASIAHLMTKAVCPQAVEAFASSLIQSGKEITPYKAYMTHFNNVSWAKKLAFGRNYFQTVETCAKAFAALITVLYSAVILKDRRQAQIQLFVNTAIAFAITAADVFIFIADGGVRGSIKNPPQWLTGWSNWEYWTGFIAGLLIALILVVSASKQPPEDFDTPPCPLPKKKLPVFLRNYALFAYPVISALALPLANRLTDENDFFFARVSFPDEEILIIPVAAVCALLLIIPAYRVTTRELSEDRELLFDCSVIYFTFFFAAAAIIFFCTGNAYFLNGSKTDISVTMYASAAAISLISALMNKVKQQDAGIRRP